MDEKQIWTTKDLAEGRVAIKYGASSLERLRVVLKEAFPDSSRETIGDSTYYFKRDGSNDYECSYTLFQTTGVPHISEQEIFLEEEYRKEMIALAHGKLAELRIVSAETSTTKKLPCVSVYQNGICVVKDFHYTSTDDVAGDFYAQNETQEIFVPKNCVIVFDKIVSRQPLSKEDLNNLSNK